MENTELIEQYLEGKLSPTERLAFEERVSNEAIFSEEVALQRQIRQGLRSVGRSRILAQLEEVETRMSAYHPPTQIIALNERVRQRFYWAAAAVIVLLIPIYLFLKSHPTHEKLFATYFVPYAPTVSQTSTQEPLSRALNLYRQKNYAQALPIFEEITGILPDSVLFYKANVLLQLEKPADAISTLQKIDTHSAFYEEAQWYLALAFLQNDQMAESKETLRRIHEQESHPYQHQATTLLKEIQ